jgi:Lon-like protease
MNELTNKFWPAVKYLAIPYLFLLFLLFFPIDYQVTAPGGLTDVDLLIEIDTEEPNPIAGSFSTTYVISIPRMTFFQFIISYFSPQTDVYALAGDNLNYTNNEIQQISYLDKATSVQASVIVAYQAAQAAHPDVAIGVIEKVLVFGKATYLSHYAQIAFGDEFVQMVGDNGIIVTDFENIGANSTLSSSYDFTFRNEAGETYTVTLTKDALNNRFGLTLKRYYLVDMETTSPAFAEKPSVVGGPSGGLLQALYIYSQLVDTDITKGLNIAGTGTIEYNGAVGYIGGVKQKIITAYYKGADLFFIPYLNSTYAYDNYLEAVRVCEELGINHEGWLIPVASFQDAIDYLEGLGE